MLDRQQQGAFRSPSDFWGRIRLARRVIVGCELGSSGSPHRNSAEFGSRQVHWRFAKTRTLQATCALAGNAVFRAGLDPPKVSSFTGLSCHQKGYGLGKVVESWSPTAIPLT